MNNKGFAITTILYSLLIMATLVLFLLIGVFSFERKSTDDFNASIRNDLNNYIINYNSTDINVVTENQKVVGQMKDCENNIVKLNNPIKFHKILNYGAGLDDQFFLGFTDSNKELRVYKEKDINNSFILKKDLYDSTKYNICNNNDECLSLKNNESFSLDTKNVLQIEFLSTGMHGYYIIKLPSGKCLESSLYISLDDVDDESRKLKASNCNSGDSQIFKIKNN